MKKIIYCLLITSSNCFASGDMRIFWDSLKFESNKNIVKAYFESDFKKNLIIEIKFNSKTAVIKNCEIVKIISQSNYNSTDLSTMDMLISTSISHPDPSNLNIINRNQDVLITYKDFLGSEEEVKKYIFSFKNRKPYSKTRTNEKQFILNENETHVDYKCIKNFTYSE